MISVVEETTVCAEVRRTVGMVRTALISYEKTWRSLLTANQIAMEAAPNTSVGGLGYRSPDFGENIQLIDVDILLLDLGTARGTRWGVVRDRLGTVADNLGIVVVRDPGRTPQVNAARDLDRTLQVNAARYLDRILQVNDVRDPDRILQVNVVRDPGRILQANVRELGNFERTRTHLATPPRQRPLLKDGS